ncbi:ATP-binding protein [Sorangium sp. So ce295]|uniref:ATP-binding protein n=1 Tax=Sorangium sp. So ce295 TaxID=3133295 RepID=UPI003F60E024
MVLVRAACSLGVIENALDVSHHGSALAVGARPLPRGDVHGVEIAVRDAGCGIRAEDLGRIFEPFFTTMPPGQGTGLGLSLMHRFIEEHHSSSVSRASRARAPRCTFGFLRCGPRRRGECES